MSLCSDDDDDCTTQDQRSGNKAEDLNIFVLMPWTFMVSQI